MLGRSAPTLDPGTTAITGINEYFHREGLTDGLPIIPPTPELVHAMAAASGRAAGDVLGIVPPRNGVATIESLAANAVMAGCRPEHMPLFLAAVEVILDEKFNLYGLQATTSPAHPGFVVNGPVRAKLGVNCGYGCLGPGASSRVNMSIGRAIRLVMLNLGGAAPGELDRATHGEPGKLSLFFGENEEESPWGPLHADFGFKPTDSVITGFGAYGFSNIHDNATQDGEEMLLTIAHSMTSMGSNNMYIGRWFLIVLGLEHAATIANAGFSKYDVIRFLFEKARVPLAAFPKVLRDHIVDLRADQGITATHVGPMASLDSLGIAVAGGIGKHSVIFHSAVTENRVSRLVAG